MGKDKKEGAIDPLAGQRAAARLRELAQSAADGGWARSRREKGESLHEASERLAEAVCFLDPIAAEAAWNEGGRLELADQLRSLSESTRGWGMGARMWASGWLASNGKSPERALEMARWLDERGSLFAQRNRKVEEAARSAVPGSEAWRQLRVESARQWPKMFEPVEGRAPGVAAILCALARGWADAGLLGEAGAKPVADVILKGCVDQYDPRALAHRMLWLASVLPEKGLGATMDDPTWVGLARKCESEELAPLFRGLLEQAGVAPSKTTLSAIAALGAVRGDPLLMAAAAERMDNWAWAVDADEANKEAERAHGGATAGMAAGSAPKRGGKISALHAAAMGAKGRRPWNNAGLMALLSIPEARARAAMDPTPRALVHWGASDIEWAAGEAPELLESDEHGRCVAHEWARAFGPSAVKRVAALAKGSCGWMMAQADKDGLTPMRMVEAHQKAKDLGALYAGWESGAIARETPEQMAAAEGEEPKARAPRL